VYVIPSIDRRLTIRAPRAGFAIEPACQPMLEGAHERSLLVAAESWLTAWRDGE
jgi:hypothetical protein